MLVSTAHSTHLDTRSNQLAFSRGKPEKLQAKGLEKARLAFQQENLDANEWNKS